MAGRLAAIEPVGIAQEWLAGHPDVAAAFALWPARTADGPDDRVRVLGEAVPPYPLLRVVATPGGSLNDARWRVSPMGQLESWGDTDGYPGPEALQNLVVTAAEALKELEDRDYAPWEAVVTHVEMSWPFPLDDPTGQARWIVSWQMTCHPPLAPELAPEHAQAPAPSEEAAYAATRDDFMPLT